LTGNNLKLTTELPPSFYRCLLEHLNREIRE